MEQANLNLKHRLVVAQRDKARQALQYSKERTRLLVLAQEKVTEQIAILQQDAKRQQAGEPLGPAMLAENSADLRTDLSTDALWGTW